MRAPGGVPASLWGDSTLPEVATDWALAWGNWWPWCSGVAQRGQEEYHQCKRRRFEPVRWCMGTRRAGGKMAATGISGASALPRCAASSAGPAGAGRWLRRCWGMNLTGCWSALLRSLQRASRAASEMLDPPRIEYGAGSLRDIHPEGETLPTPGSGRMGPTGAGGV